MLTIRAEQMRAMAERRLSDATSANAPVGGMVTPCPESDPQHWIEIELLDDAGQPVASVAYQVVLPDGQVARGYLDGRGSVRIAPLTSGGSCQISFPELDGGGW